MKYKNVCLLIAALSMSGGAARAQDHILAISEVGESPTPVITYDEIPVTPDPSSVLAKDRWLLVLPAGFALLGP
ncbi:MAG TPA: hypothetical protein VN829_18220, partial [Dongiaceae bacterium]|nr:hypothetical protein [Dongiaceae bacterium]